MDLKLINGASYPECSVRIETVFLNYYAVQFMAGGSMYMQRGTGKLVVFDSPTFFWTDRVSNYRYGPGVTGFWNHNWLTFSGQTADDYYAPLLEMVAPEGYVHVRRCHEVQKLFNRLIRELSEVSTGGRAIHLLNQLLATVEEEKAGLTVPRDRLSEIRDGIEADPTERPDFQALARKFGYSYGNFRRLFRARFGVAPHHYLLTVRMKAAAAALTETDEAIQAIGFRFGYEDPARFSKAFTLHYGVSPRSYREAARLHTGPYPPHNYAA